MAVGDPDDGLAPHGTVKRYAQDCRCEPCVEAARPWQEAYNAIPNSRRLDPEERKRRRQERRKRRRREALEQAAAGAVDIPHGTRRGSNDYGCTCDPCREANRRYTNERRANQRTG